MKKQLSCLLAGALVLSFGLTGCGLTKEKAIEKYKAALAKGQEMESYTMTADIDISVGISGMNMDIDMAMDGAVKDKGKTGVFNMTMSTMGQQSKNTMYMKDENIYTSVAGADGKFLKQSYQETTGMNYQQLLDVNNGEMTSIYNDAVEKAENFSFTQLDDKSINITFDFPQETLTAMEDEMVEIISGNMSQSMEEQLRTQFSAMGMEGEELDTMVKQMLQVYSKLFESLTIQRIAMDTTINKDGFAVKQKMEMDMTLDFSALMKMLGEVDDASMEQLKEITFNMAVSTNMDNINKDVAVEIPEFTEEDLLSPEEAAAYQLAA